MPTKELEAQLANGFLQLAQSAWAKRGEITNYGDIYVLYGNSTDEPAKFDGGILTTFLGNLVSASALGGAVRISIQQYPSDYDWATLDDSVVSANASLPTRVRVNDFWNNFFHFMNPACGKSATKRVYMHAAKPIQDNCLSILKALLPLFPTMPGFAEIKTAGPGGTDRSDTLVAYLCDGPSVTKLLDEIKKSCPAGWFQDGVPMGTLPMPYIRPGIGGADEAVPVTVDGKAIRTGSYGSLLGDLLYHALKVENPEKAKTYDGFLEVILTTCKKGDVDPKLPYLAQRDYKKLYDLLGSTSTL